MNLPTDLRNRLARCEKKLNALQRRGQALDNQAARLAAGAAAPSASRPFAASERLAT